MNGLNSLWYLVWPKRLLTYVYTGYRKLFFWRHYNRFNPVPCLSCSDMHWASLLWEVHFHFKLQMDTHTHTTLLFVNDANWCLLFGLSPSNPLNPLKIPDIWTGVLITSSLSLYLCIGPFLPLAPPGQALYSLFGDQTPYLPNPFFAFILRRHSSLALFFSSTGPFSASPCLFLSDWPSQWGYRAPTCLHLPPASVARWVRCTKSLFSLTDIHPESLFSQPLTPGHGNRGRNVRSDWQDKEHSLTLPHKRIWDIFSVKQWWIWAWLDQWWADDCQKSTSSLPKPDYLCVLE